MTQRNDQIPGVLHAAIAAVILAAAPHAARAVNVNADGFGQALVYPYYNVNAGNQTLISVTNTSERGKALKVRFRESRNGRNVLEFNLYLAAQDTWTAALFALSNTGPANVATNDGACTVPRITVNNSLPTVPGSTLHYVPFRNFGYAINEADAGPDNLERTREGFIELIEMGTLRAGTPSAASAEVNASGDPANCQALVTAWTAGGYWATNPNQDLDPPSGGLIGNATIVDVADGTLYGARPTVLDAFRAMPLHGAPGVESPTLADAQSNPDFSATATLMVGGQQVDSTYPPARSVDAVSAVLAAEQVLNEFVTDAALGARTDWVLTFPTKQFYADPKRAGAAAIAPFTHLFAGPATAPSSCEHVALTALDRAGQGAARSCATYASDPGACQLPSTQLCNAVEVLSFGGGGSPLASANAVALTGLPAGALGGLGRIDLGNQGNETHALRPSIEGHVHAGLPAIGFNAVQFINGQVSGNTLANYSDAGPHRPKRACTGAEGAGCAD